MPRLKIFVAYYFGGAGGKFITNCLSMSGQLAFPNFVTWSNFCRDQDIKIIEKALLDTIPPKHQHREWFKYEQGCTQLFGPRISKIQQGDMTHDLGFITRLTKLGNVWLPVMCHTDTELQNVLDYFSDHELFAVRVNGTPEFIDSAIRLKWPDPRHSLCKDSFARFEQSCTDIEFDFVIDNWNPLNQVQHHQIESIAQKINLVYNHSMAESYIKKYIEFHH